MMVGDRYDTDVLGGASVGVKTCLVLSGCHRLEQQRFFPHARPDFFADSVMELHAFTDEEIAQMHRREHEQAIRQKMAFVTLRLSFHIWRRAAEAERGCESTPIPQV